MHTTSFQFLEHRYIFFIIFCLSASFSELNAEESTLPPLEEITSEKTNIDWSKPVVSRGFGYQAQTDNDKAFEAEYKKGQIAYFFKDYKKALSIWEPLATKNHTESIASIAWLYHAGLGVKIDYMKAYNMYKHAAEKNNAVAQNNLGVLYEKGLHVKKNLVQAQKWFKRSAENGYRFGQYNYASALEKAYSGEANMQEANFWYRKAAEQGVDQAKSKLNNLK